MHSQSLFNNTDTENIIHRLNNLKPDAKPQWGKMKVAQMMAHCRKSIGTAMGEHVIPRVPFPSNIIGSLMRKGVLGPKPFSRNSPTDKTYKLKGDFDFEKEKSELTQAIRKFSGGGPACCTTHPHPFFGKFTPEEWAVFEWKHLDHHLRQFGG